jgi:hypothetical protein
VGKFKIYPVYTALVYVGSFGGTFKIYQPYTTKILACYIGHCPQCYLTTRFLGFSPPLPTGDFVPKRNFRNGAIIGMKHRVTGYDTPVSVSNSARQASASPMIMLSSVGATPASVVHCGCKHMLWSILIIYVRACGLGRVNGRVVDTYWRVSPTITLQQRSSSQAPLSISKEGLSHKSIFLWEI